MQRKKIKQREAIQARSNQEMNQFHSRREMEEIPSTIFTRQCLKLLKDIEFNISPTQTELKEFKEFKKTQNSEENKENEVEFNHGFEEGSMTIEYSCECSCCSCVGYRKDVRKRMGSREFKIEYLGQIPGI